MRAGFVLPGGDPERQVAQAVAAEAAGWDAVFVWEGGAASDRVTRWQERGATWWLESRWGPDRSDLDARIDAGPPRPQGQR